MKDEDDIIENLIENIQINIQILREYFSTYLDTSDFDMLINDENFQWLLDEIDEIE